MSFETLWDMESAAKCTKTRKFQMSGKQARDQLQRGMTLAVEPMITQGSWEIDVLTDDWTAVTVDGGLAAHYENTVVITDGEPELLTL